MSSLVEDPSTASGTGQAPDELAAARGIAIGIVCGGLLWGLAGSMLRLLLEAGR